MYDDCFNDGLSNDGWFNNDCFNDGLSNDGWFDDGLSTSEPDEVEALPLNDCDFNWLNIREILLVS